MISMQVPSLSSEYLPGIDIISARETVTMSRKIAWWIPQRCEMIENSCQLELRWETHTTYTP